MDIEAYKKWLKSHKIKQKDLANAIGCRPDHLSEVLSGKKPLSKMMEQSLQMFASIHYMKSLIQFYFKLIHDKLK
jgi:antitoxin component HigA of HigAB toxin-antitoxin module